MNIRRKQEMELEAAVHGVPTKKGGGSRPEEPPGSAVPGSAVPGSAVPGSAVPGSTTLSPATVDLDRQLSEGIVKGLPFKIIKRKK